MYVTCDFKCKKQMDSKRKYGFYWHEVSKWILFSIISHLYHYWLTDCFPVEKTIIFHCQVDICHHPLLYLSSKWLQRECESYDFLLKSEKTALWPFLCPLVPGISNMQHMQCCITLQNIRIPLRARSRGRSFAWHATRTVGFIPSTAKIADSRYIDK
jgi:hypothetical protein